MQKVSTYQTTFISNLLTSTSISYGKQVAWLRWAMLNMTTYSQSHVCTAFQKVQHIPPIRLAHYRTVSLHITHGLMATT